MPDAREIAAGLCALDLERLTEWSGPGGAAYNAITEDLTEMGLLDQRGVITPLGQQVRTILMEKTNARD